MQKNLQRGLKCPLSLSKEFHVVMVDFPKVWSFGGDEISQVLTVIMAQSLHGFEEVPVLQTISTGGEAMLSVLSAGSGRSARGHGERGSSQTSK